MKFTLGNLCLFMVALACILTFNFAPRVVVFGQPVTIPEIGTWKQEYVETGWPVPIYRQVRSAELEVVETSQTGQRVLRSAHYDKRLRPLAVYINTSVALTLFFLGLSLYRMVASFVARCLSRSKNQ